MEGALEALEGREVDGDVFADGGMWAAARFDCDNSLGREGVVSGKELGVFAREDVVRHGGDGVAVAEGFGEFEHEGCFAGADGAVVG